jgi:pilus assembly protein CpaC
MALGKDGALADTSTISSGGVVQVEVKVVEFNKTAMKQIGINFQNRNGGFAYGFARPGTGLPGNTGLLPGMKEGNSSNEAVSPISSAFRLVFGSTKGLWNADVELLQSNGMARVLAEPTLVALSGQSASFLAGGELPILEPQGLGTTTITYKPFGIGLTVTPTVLAANRIALKVAPEASDLDYSNAIVLNNVQIPRSPPAAPTPRSSWAMARASSSVAWSAPTSSPTSARFRCWATCRSSARSSATSTTSARTRSW